MERLAFLGVDPADPDELRLQKAPLRDRYRFEERGEIEVNGKGRLKAYVVVGRRGDGDLSAAALG